MTQYSAPTGTATLQQRPAPIPVWTPPELPPVGQVRTDGTDAAIHLPLGPTDWAPWRLLNASGPAGGRAITHAAVHQPEWQILPTLPELVRERDATNSPTPQPPASPTEHARVYYHDTEDAQPDDVTAVVTPDGQVWPRSDWHGEHAWMPWNELLSTHGGAVEVPVQALLQHGYTHQQHQRGGA